MVYKQFMGEGKQNTSTEGCPHEGTHCFFLKRTDNSQQSFVQVDFSPVNPTPSQPQATLPSFNPDQHHFTPSFRLPLESAKIEKHLETYLSIHQERVSEMSQEKEELLVPRPSRSNSYCCICKTPFDDYLTHVNIPAHTNLLRASTFQKDIQELTHLFQPVAVVGTASKKAGKTQRIRKTVRKGRAKAKVSGCHSSSTTCLDQMFDNKAQVL